MDYGLEMARFPPESTTCLAWSVLSGLCHRNVRPALCEALLPGLATAAELFAGIGHRVRSRHCTRAPAVPLYSARPHHFLTRQLHPAPGVWHRWIRTVRPVAAVRAPSAVVTEDSDRGHGATSGARQESDAYHHVPIRHLPDGLREPTGWLAWHGVESAAVEGTGRYWLVSIGVMKEAWLWPTLYHAQHVKGLCYPEKHD